MPKYPSHNVKHCNWLANNTHWISNLCNSRSLFGWASNHCLQLIFCVKFSSLRRIIVRLQRLGRTFWYLYTGNFNANKHWPTKYWYLVHAEYAEGCPKEELLAVPEHHIPDPRTTQQYKAGPTMTNPRSHEVQRNMTSQILSPHNNIRLSQQWQIQDP